MVSNTDPARELVRRAFEGASPFDVDSGLADVVRRAGRPPHDDGVVALEPRRRAGRRFAVVGTFAAAVVTILAVYAASAGTGPQRDVGTPPASTPDPSSNGPASNSPSSAGPSSNGPSAAPSTVTGTPGASLYAGGPPELLPSSCAASWVLELAGKEIKATRSRASAAATELPAVDPRRGPRQRARQPGRRRIWPLVPVNGGAAVQPPLTFRGGGWPGPVSGHAYEVLYLDEAAARAARPGDDAHAAFETARTISLRVIA